MKRKIVKEVNSGLLSHSAAAKKYGLNRKTIDAWVTELCYLNLQPLQIAKEVRANGKQGASTKMLAKQAQT
ncbi:hypothetical protein FJM65_18475 [Pontibacter mangrovi]|uniref:Helix-turn-helix domain-containing protein n=1 Tax=Pontibacter mangrovi TaxID=2589816 RepID=A0A501VYC4_9BACT|nr:hypothetical protein FJM65_18475 [Pontibacter mangrovi]